MSSAVQEFHYAKMDSRGKVPLPSKFRRILKAEPGSWLELQVHIIDNTPAIVCTLAKEQN